MENNYKKVPDIITPKDLNYLTDMFNWNFTGYKLISDMCNYVDTEEINKCLKKTSDAFYDNLNTILDTINEMGVEANE